MNESTIELIKTIKLKRKEKGLTQVELAKKCHIPQSTVGRIENFSMNPSVDIICCILNALDLKIDFEKNEKEKENIVTNTQLDQKEIHPLKSGDESVTYIKATLENCPNIEVGDYTYFDGQNFQEHVTHHYDFIGDKLIIGKFCQIGRNVEFIMNGANHQMNAVSTYPFYIFHGWEQNPPSKKDLPYKGDTVIGNDVWIGQNVTFLPGVHVGDGCIIGANAVVASDIPPYCIVVGNPAKIIKKRFDDEMIELLEQLKWWNRTPNEIQKIIPLLANSDLSYVKEELKLILSKND